MCDFRRPLTVPALEEALVNADCDGVGEKARCIIELSCSSIAAPERKNKVSSPSPPSSPPRGDPFILLVVLTASPFKSDRPSGDPPEDGGAGMRDPGVDGRGRVAEAETLLVALNVGDGGRNMPPGVVKLRLCRRSCAYVEVT